MTERFGDVCDFVRGPFGGALKKNIFKDEGYAIYEQQHAIYNQFDTIRYFVDEDKFKEMSRFELFPGDLIMSCSGTMGKIAIVPDGIEKGIINQALLKLTPKGILRPHFLKLWMESRNFQGQIEALSQGAAIKNMASVKILKEIQVPIPEAAEQKRIVTTLDQAFADIEKARANAEQNLKNARELFDSYLQQVFSERGEGWITSKLKDICSKITDGVHKKPTYVDDGVPFIKINNLTAGAGISFDGVSYISKEDHELFCKRTNPEKGDILITKDGTIGIVRIIDTEIEFSIFVSVALIKPIDKGLSPYLRFVLESPLIQDQIKPRGAALKHLYLRDLREFSIPIAPDSMKKEIVNKLESLLDQVELLESIYRKKLEALEELKKSILQKAFSGELTASTPKAGKEQAA